MSKKPSFPIGRFSPFRVVIWDKMGSVHHIVEDKTVWARTLEEAAKLTSGTGKVRSRSRGYWPGVHGTYSKVFTTKEPSDGKTVYLEVEKIHPSEESKIRKSSSERLLSGDPKEVGVVGSKFTRTFSTTSPPAYVSNEYVVTRKTTNGAFGRLLESNVRDMEGWEA